MPADWSQRIFTWFDQHGRHDLPWQHPRSAYRVWVSEVMLQQTTVNTVIPYFERFMQHFPDVHSLAVAPQDDVMALWSGLGYYARARNLHRCAQVVVQDHGGEFPDRVEALRALPGLGRSTAAAIVAQAFERPAAILDGNVKRLLARHGAIEGWPGSGPVQARLWRLAEERLPQQRAADYAQALMDLGATVCRRKKPDCAHCPLASDCRALRCGLVEQIPAPRPRKPRPLKHAWFLLAEDKSGRILLEKRPASGIWGGLWVLPEASTVDAFAAHAQDLQPVEEGLRHEFSHFSLQLQLVRGRPRQDRVQESATHSWHTVDAALQLGLPQPIRRLIETHCR